MRQDLIHAFILGSPVHMVLNTSNVLSSQCYMLIILYIMCLTRAEICMPVELLVI
jgi:hypothetical protein